MWTVKTKKEGSQVLVPDFKKNTLRKLLSDKEPIGSGKMWKHLVEIMGDNHPSRASVIFFLNDLVEFGYAKWKDATGKGGHHRLYYTELTIEEFIQKIHTDIREKLTEATDQIFIFF